MSINRNLANFATKVTSDGNSYITITVTVSGGKFVIDGTSQQIVSLAKGQTYRFDNSDSSNSGHPFVFSTDSSNSSAFTTGVSTNGSAGSSGSYVEVTLEQDAPDRIFYYCSNHSGMGSMVKTAPVGDANFGTFVDTFTFPTSDGSADQVLKTDGSGALSFGTPSSGGIASVAADSTPQLGGDLDVDGNSIVSTSNGNINITPNGSGKVVIDGLSHPTADGTANTVLTTNGSGVLSFQTIGGNLALGEVSDDSTPQLGGDLDVVTRSIVSTSNRNINITPNGSGKVVLDGLSYPDSDGSANYVLKTDGSGNLGWSAVSSLGGTISELSDDSTPQLGGDLDVVNRSIVSTSNQNINITPHGTGKVVLDGLSYPTADGSANQVLKTDGAGNLSFTTVSSGGLGELSDDTTPQLGGDLDVVTRSIVSTSNRDINITPNGSGKVVLDGLSFPTSDGTANTVLTTNGSGQLSFQGVGGNLALGELSDDSTPQLGGDLDVVTRSIVSTDNRDINITPNGSGKVVLDGLSFPTSDGSADQVLKTDGSGQLSFVDQASGGGGSSFTATASGTLANGDKVVVNSDGTVSVVRSIAETFSAGTPATAYSSNIAGDPTAVYHSGANKIVAVYRDSSTNVSYASLGTISGTSITFANQVTFESSNTIDYFASAYDSSAQAVVVCYRKQGSPFYFGAKAITVSGTTITVGSEKNLLSQQVGFCDVVFDSNVNRLVFAALDFDNSYALKAVVATVSGTTITSGSATTIHSATYNHQMVFDSGSNKVIIVYRDNANSLYGAARVLTVSNSGNSLSVGNATYFNSDRSDNPRVGYDANANKSIVLYTDFNNSQKQTLNVGTVSDTSISFGSKITGFADFSASYRDVVYDPDGQNMAMFIRRWTSDLNDLSYFPVTISGTSATVGSASEILGSSDQSESYGRKYITYDTTANKFLYFFRNDSDNEAQGVVVQTPFTDQNLTATNYVGISDAAYSDGATATIQTAGSVDDAQSGLTAGQLYYVQNDGTLSTTADSPSVIAGTAISATKLIVKG